MKRTRNGNGFTGRKQTKFRRTVPGSFAFKPRSLPSLGIELKFYDQKLLQSALASPTDATGGEKNPSAVISLNTIVQGDGESQRDGRQVTNKKISVKVIIKLEPQANEGTPAEPTVVWVALIRNKQTNGLLLNSEDVVTNPGANAITAASPFNNLKFVKKFSTLATHTEVFDAPAYAVFDGTNIDQGGQMRAFEFHVPLNFTTNYSAATEDIANTVDNSINIIAFCNNTDLAPSISYSSRLRFVG